MKKLKGLSKNEKYLLACSYGPDSMSLFYLLKKQGYNFEVAHVNYALREEAKDETIGLEKYCKENGIICHTLYAHVNKDGNIEKQCRDIRYNYFKDLVIKYHFDQVLVAHNLDDFIETYLMQKKRNSIVKTYGISSGTTIYGVSIYRPLLDVRKAELEEICLKNNVPFAIDSSNLSDDFLRNRIRHEIVSKMTMEDILKVYEEIIEKTKHRNEIIRKINSFDTKQKEVLLSLNDEEFVIFMNLGIEFFNESYSLSKKFCLDIKEKLASNNNNFIIKLNEKVLLVNEYGKVDFKLNQDVLTYEIKVDYPQIINNEYVYFELIKDLDKRNLTLGDFPLTIRPMQKGDKYQIKDYEVEVRRLYIDWKMPILTRKRWPLIVNRYGVVKYIPRYRSDFDISKSPNFYVKS